MNDSRNSSEGSDSGKIKAEAAEGEAAASCIRQDMSDDESYKLALVRRVLAQYVSTYYGDDILNREGQGQGGSKNNASTQPGMDGKSIIMDGRSGGQEVSEDREQAQGFSRDTNAGQGRALPSLNDGSSPDKPSENNKRNKAKAHSKTHVRLVTSTTVTCSGDPPLLDKRGSIPMAGGNFSHPDIRLSSAPPTARVVAKKKRDVKVSRKEPPPNVTIPTAPLAGAVAARPLAPALEKNAIPPNETKEAKKRRLNRITAKNKRARQKIEIEVLSEQRSGLACSNQTLKTENEQLEKSLLVVNQLVAQSGLEPIVPASTFPNGASAVAGPASVPTASMPIHATAAAPHTMQLPMSQQPLSLKANDLPLGMTASTSYSPVTNTYAMQPQQLDLRHPDFAVQHETPHPAGGNNAHTSNSLQQLFQSKADSGGNAMELLLSVGSCTNVVQQLLGSSGGNENNLLQLLSTGDAGVSSQVQQLLLQGGQLGGNSTVNSNGILGSVARTLQQHGHAPYQQLPVYQQLQRALSQQPSVPQSLAPLINLSLQHQPQPQPQPTTSSSHQAALVAPVLQLLQSGHLNPAQAQQLLLSVMNSQRGIVNGTTSTPWGNTNHNNDNPGQHQSLLQQLLLLQQPQPQQQQQQPSRILADQIVRATSVAQLLQSLGQQQPQQQQLARPS